MKKAAIVTGASSGIGLRICKMLCENDYYVFGIARNFDNKDFDVFSNSNFNKIVCDVQDTGKLVTLIDKIKKENDVFILINNAGVGYYGLHEELNYKMIQEMVRINLEAPMIITNRLLRSLKANKGIIINISSVTSSKSNPHGCSYGATKAGLTSFSHSLFDEARKYGVKVVNIEPDMTKTGLYRNANFEAEDDFMCSLDPQEIADIVEYIIKQRSGLVISDITIKPQFHRIKKKK